MLAGRLGEGAAGLTFPRFIIAGWIALAITGVIGYGMAFGWWLSET